MAPGCPPSLPHRHLMVLVRFGQSYHIPSQRTLFSTQTPWKPKKRVPDAAFEHARRIWLIRLSGRIRTFHGGLGRRGACEQKKVSLRRVNEGVGKECPTRDRGTKRNTKHSRIASTPHPISYTLITKHRNELFNTRQCESLLSLMNTFRSYETSLQRGHNISLKANAPPAVR